MLMAHFKLIGSTNEGMMTNSYGPQSAQDKELFFNRISNIKTLLGSRNWLL
jgi:hypothetical protein